MPTRLPLRTFFSSFALAFATVAGAASVRAQPPAAPDPPPPDPAAASETQAGQTEAPPPDRQAGRATVGGMALEVNGRVFAAAVYDAERFEDLDRTQRPSDALSLSVPSARAGLKVGLLDWVSAVIEVEVSGRVRLRDGFVQAKKKRWAVRAGQFKMPISAFHMESPWTLPLARRGWLHELLSDHLLLTGRREGFMGTLQGGGFWDPALTVGVFRSIQWGVDAGDPVVGLSPAQQTVVGRLSVKPAGVEIAAVGQRRVTQQAQGLTGYWTAGGDATGDWEFESTGLRFWAESLVGKSWYKADPAAPGTPTFVEARMLWGWRWGGLKRGKPYVEPFATVGLLEPDTAVVSDLFVEAMAGINVGHWRSTRLTLQLEWSEAGRNFPRGMFWDFEQRFLASHRAAMLQVGAAF
jgi:hypothetical protein